jgi:hypothetical protein
MLQHDGIAEIAGTPITPWETQMAKRSKSTRKPLRKKKVLKKKAKRRAIKEPTPVTGELP